MQQINIYEEAEDFIKKGSMSSVSYDSTQAPFFHKDKYKKGEIGFDTSKVNKIFETLPLPDKLKRIYLVLGRVDNEFYYGDWTLLSLNKVQSLYRKYCNNNQTRAIDFAMIYAGMGHIVVCSYDFVTGKVYYRHSGGANGYERDDMYKFSLKYTPKNSELYDIEHWFNIIEQKETDAFSLPLVKEY